MAAPKYQPLGEETFGEKLRRAARRCRDAYGYSYQDTVNAVSPFIPTSDMSLKRHEELPELPSDTRRRQLIYLLALAYGYEPESFGLTESDCNPAFDMRKVRAALHPSTAARRDAKASTRWGEGKGLTNWSTAHDRGAQRWTEGAAGQGLRQVG